MSMQPIFIDTSLASTLSASAPERQMRITPFRLLVEWIGEEVVAAIDKRLRPFCWQFPPFRVIKVSA
jgi:hypothetical protein